jgi:hypothetical protein
MHLFLEGLVTLEHVTEICTSPNVLASASAHFATVMKGERQTEDGQSF